jgi:hypothetical protein
MNQQQKDYEHAEHNCTVCIARKAREWRERNKRNA